MLLVVSYFFSHQHDLWQMSDDCFPKEEKNDSVYQKHWIDMRQEPTNLTTKNNSQKTIATF